MGSILCNRRRGWRRCGSSDALLGCRVVVAEERHLEFDKSRMVIIAIKGGFKVWMKI
jgi:hypothetical protein